MIQKHSLAIAAIILSTFVAIQARGAGFALYENSSRGTAICGAFVARADDVSALFYNSSGMTQLDGRHITTGVNTYTGVVDLHLPGGARESAKDKTWIVPNFYMSQKVNDTIWMGLGAFAPYGLGNDYRENWYGRYNVYSTEVSCIELNPNIAFKVNDSFSFALGMSRQSFAMIHKRKLRMKNLVIQGIIDGATEMGMPMSIEDAKLAYQADETADYFDNMQDINQELNLDKPAYRFNMNFRYQINDKISIGAQYRSKVSYTLSGDVEYDNFPLKDAAYDQVQSSFPIPININHTIDDIKQTLTNARVEVNISLPDIYIFGVAYRITDQLTVEADIVRTQWSTYDRIDYHFHNGVGHQVDKAEWSNVHCYRFGAEYQVNPQLTARAGYLFDESPLHDDYIDFSLPGNDRHLFTGGFGFKHNQFIIDGHYGLVICLDRDNHANKNYNAFIDYDWQHRKSYTHHLGFNVSYVF